MSKFKKGEKALIYRHWGRDADIPFSPEHLDLVEIVDEPLVYGYKGRDTTSTHYKLNPLSRGCQQIGIYEEFLYKLPAQLII